MLRAIRLRKIRAQFLESCRNLEEGRAYWDGQGPLRKGFLHAIVPVPLLGLHEDGRRLLEALEWLETEGRGRPLEEETIRHYHRLIGKGRVPNPGEYRKGRIRVVGATIPRPRPERVPALMKQLDLKLREAQEALDSDDETLVERAAEVYQRLGLVHPFEDGNGRVARLSMNHLLRRYGHGYAILPPLSRSRELWEALQEADRGRVGALQEMIRAATHPV